MNASETKSLGNFARLEAHCTSLSKTSVPDTQTSFRVKFSCHNEKETNHASASKNPAIRRYTQRFFIAMTLYVIAIASAVWIFPRFHPSGAPAYLRAILPAMPILALIVIAGLYLAEEKDEFQRSLLVRAMIWSIGATLAVTTVWGFLENFVNTVPLQPYRSSRFSGSL